MSVVNPAATALQPALGAPQLLALATATGCTVASLYYSQPILPQLAQDLGADTGSAGLIPTLTQLGYAAGILLLVPLGDRYDRRKLILGKGLGLTLLLALTALAGDLPTMLLLSLLIGISATVAQDIVPATAALASEQQRGKTVGFVMTGLLLGILLSRTISGLVSAHYSWQLLYGLAAVSVAVTVLLAYALLPVNTANSSTLSYPQLMKSLWTLWQQYPPLRRAAMVQALLHLGFAAFWTTLAPALAQLHGIGSDVAGAYGLAGAAGALLAPLAGAWADKHGSRRVASYAALLTVASFALMLTMPAFGLVGQLLLLAVAVIGFDLGVQSALIAHQSLIYSLQPAARGRLNAILVTSMFLGMALGSALGSWLLVRFDWQAVILLATGSAALAWWLRRRGD